MPHPLSMSNTRETHMNTHLSTYILLDRSASMAGSRWENAISSINTYLDTLSEECKGSNQTANITVITFDSGHTNFRPQNAQALNGVNTKPIWGSSQGNVRGILNNTTPGSTNSFDIIRNNIAVDTINRLNIDEVRPRGGTPLYESISKMIDLAHSNNNEKTVLLVVTDGEENSSGMEFTGNMVKNKIAECEKRGWEVLFLGAEFNADYTAHTLGVMPSKVINTNDSADLGQSMSFYASASMSYTRGLNIDTTMMRNK